MFLSLIVPVFNRPSEVDELLESLKVQTNPDFEIIIIEDGSTLRCDKIVENYSRHLSLFYFYKENTGPGDTRNYGASKANGDYFVFLDSDCIVPAHYVDVVYDYLYNSSIDAYGGPDESHYSFTDIQKSINYSMTSFFTTGGIRGSKKSVEKFHPRSFNMGISKQAFNALNGFSRLRFGEDIDLSIRLFENNYKVVLIEDAFVYHKRRTDFKKFYKQVYNSGLARINLNILHPRSLKIVHLLPSIFVIAHFVFILISFFISSIFLIPIFLFCLLIFIDSTNSNKSITVGFLSILSAYTQLCGYGIGFMDGVWNRLILKKSIATAFKDNFY
jgi:glycosyltransferase involved in cell wall biosynthesis